MELSQIFSKLLSVPSSGQTPSQIRGAQCGLPTPSAFRPHASPPQGMPYPSAFYMHMLSSNYPADINWTAHSLNKTSNNLEIHLLHPEIRQMLLPPGSFNPHQEAMRNKKRNRHQNTLNGHRQTTTSTMSSAATTDEITTTKTVVSSTKAQGGGTIVSSRDGKGQIHMRIEYDRNEVDMVNGIKRRLKTQKRKVEVCYDDETIDVPSQRRKLDVGESLIVSRQSHRANDSKVTEEDRMVLPTREFLAYELIVALRAKQFVIIEGPIGCGKTFIASYASKHLNLPLRVMQMGDQIDSKSLFGMYHCTEVAGEFLWKPSSFSQWLSEACLVLLEDIDLSNADVISTVVQLASIRSGMLPFGGNLTLHEDVRIVSTVSGRGKNNSVLDGVPVRITLKQLTDEELRRLVTTAYPRIAHLAKTLISIFRSIETFSPTSDSRLLTSTDLLRACSRVSELPDLSSNTSIFAELVDTWCLSSPYERAFALCLKVAVPLSITTDQVSFHLSLRQPTFSHDDESCTIGRCRLPRSLSLKNVHIHRLGHTRDVLQLMERLAVCVRNREPVLLVGETGVGKTAVVQSLASTLNIKLKVVNLSPSSDPDELIGGYKPTTISQVLEPFTHFYHSVFKSSFNIVKNRKFLDHLEACLSSGRYRDYLSLAIATAEKALRKHSLKEDTRWASVIVRARRIRSGLDRGAVPFVTSRGAVIEAAEDGHWLLIDEINLAPPESLDAIVHTISRNVHPNFRLFACMNPCTDVGKRRLPISVRTRFTEFYVGEVSDAHQLAVVVSAYLPSMKPTLVTKLVNFYLQAKQLYPTNYSLRTFCRALLFTAQNMFGNEERSLYEAVAMAFLTNLDAEEKEKMHAKIAHTFHVATHIPMVVPHGKGSDYVLVEGYWIERGTELPNPDGSYVLTKTVKSNLAEIARITSSGRFPILLEGETSVGKTSIICHLARMTGNVITRINNHEYTDIQEYIGSYVADTQGRLIFREGALVKAVRNGGWVILDELNLAPSDVIEALNRLLDDNQELFIPELNTVIQAHPRFRLFATQNPAGCYGGRKRLSRALMSRFVVLRFSQLPMEELSSMVCARSGVHKSAATKMINVLSKLRLKRSVGGVFSATDSLMTLRDVFRWAKRLVTDSTSDDWLQILANHGYFLLAGRCRNRRDSHSVVETLQNELGRNIEPIKLFAIDSPYMPKDIDTEGIVMTMSMRRMLVMTEQAWLRNEAILMVGETGGGKTTLAHLMGRGNLSTINCHERTETTDLLGRLRPRDDGGFAWSDGVVVSAMKAGVPLLIDEISLAEDSVLERLNPLFEEERTLLLSDAGVEVHSVSARDGFQIIATMNPGGDYGKKELSKALRNRFTEIWSCCDFEECELLKIFESRLSSTPEESLGPPQESPAELIVNWIAKFSKKYLHVFRHSPSVRDIIACAEIYSACAANGFLRTTAVFEAVSAVFLDALNMQKLRMTMDIKEIRRDAEDMLDQLSSDVIVRSPIPSEILIASDYIKIGAFSISFGPLDRAVPKGFSFRAPTCVSNFYRIARALLINKPILLEGAPGCGKSSTVMALAALTGHPITRLNLSDQTDLSDLFGSDVPIVSEDGSISFQWVDGPILSAIKRGEWVLLDEMNLAPQAVLEGLNACFDHRRMLYVAELNRSFQIPPGSNCRFFACQNPHAQGGNRRALPKSFVNRFTSIYIEDLLDEDILLILHELPAAVGIGRDHLKAMISITAELSADQSLFGAPFSFNLRDLLRWVQLFEKIKDMQVCFHVLFLNRMRREEDRKKLRDLYSKFFGEPCVTPPLALSVDDKEVRLGKVCLARFDRKCELFNSSHRLLSSQFALMHQLAVCVDMQWMALIIGPRNSGKRSTLQNLADICGVQLQTIVLNSETDAQELIGSYEQSIDDNVINDAKEKLCEILSAHVEEAALKEVRSAEDLTQLETITEIVLSNIKDNNDVVDDCHLVLARSARSSMRFEWVDSLFVRAYLNGHWLLIEDVNLCSAAVLDRLNSCLENDGRLVVFERHSSFKPLEAHPNFRVFLSMDAKNGEISRAMRNRSVEIFITTEQQWSSSQLDVAAVTLSRDMNISSKRAKALCSLSIEKQLHFSILLSEMSIEHACRAVGLPSLDDEDADATFVIPPLVKEIATERFDLWLLNAWKNSCTSNYHTLFLSLLSTSTRVLRGAYFQQIFGDMALSTVSRLRELTKSLDYSHHSIDPRFHNCSLNEGIDMIQRFVVTTVCEWFIAFIGNFSVETGSAEYLSRTVSKYEESNVDIGVKNLQLISKIVDAIMKTLNDTSELDDERTIFSLCLRLALFVVASRRRLNARTSYAPLYHAWAEIHQLVRINGSENSSYNALYSKLVHFINFGWSLDAYDSFVNSYLPLYKSYRLTDPFTCDEENQRLCAVECPTLVEIETKNTQIAVLLEENAREITLIDEENSPISKALDLLRTLRELHLFFSKGVICQSEMFKRHLAFAELSWYNDRSRRFAQVVAILNSNYFDDQKVFTLKFTDAFSTVFLSFWDAIAFDPTLSALSISNVCQSQLKSLAIHLWRLAPNSPMLSKLISKELESVSNGLPGWSTVVVCRTSKHGWERRLETALEIMHNALPPPDTLDPVIFEEERARYQLDIFNAVDQPLQVLARWRGAIARQPADCDSLSVHPVIAALWQTREELQKTLSKTREKPMAYRQKASLYFSMCSEMRSFCEMTEAIVPTIRILDTDDLWRNFDSSRLQIILAQLRSFTVSANSFRKAITSKFGSFVDVSVTFLQGVDIFLCAVHEVCDIIETAERRAALHVSTNFPVEFQLEPSLEGIENTELLTWCCCDASPMPLRLKVAIIRRRIASSVNPQFDLEWVRHQWQRWYERNIAKSVEKDYVYLTRTEEEKDELDVEEFFSEREQEREILPESELASLLVGKRELSNNDVDFNYSLALLWLRRILYGVRCFQDELCSFTLDSDLSLMHQIITRVHHDPGGVIDVYRTASLAQFLRASKILTALRKRTREIREKWPEQVSLKLILEAIDNFLNARLSATHVKMTKLVENVIEQCEEWNKVADRANNLQNELVPLRELMVEWRKMEVRSWRDLLSRVVEDGRLQAQLVAFPLFDAMFKVKELDDQTALIAMATEWITNATLLDYVTRIRSVHCLAQWANHLHHSSMALHLHSIAAHFEQYLPAVELKIREAREPAEQSLRDYVKIVKYNDLSLWNIKVSSQKARTHLYKIVRKFREALSVQTSSIFDTLVPMSCANIPVAPCLAEVKVGGRVHKARQLAEDICVAVTKLCETTGIVQLAEQAKSCDETVRTQINYRGEDSEKEKQQGYARNSRQRLVAMVIKELQALGLNARKAAVLNREVLTRSSLTEVASHRAEELSVRKCAGGRNACIRKSLFPNNQLGVATRRHLEGVVDYGMSWIMKCHKTLVDWEEFCALFTRKTHALERIQSNAEVGWFVNHEQMSLSWNFLHLRTTKLLRLTEIMQRRIAHVPDTDVDEQELKEYEHPLSRLHDQSPELERLQRNVTESHSLSQHMNKIASTLFEESEDVYDKASVTQQLEYLSSDCTMLDAFLDDLQCWFEFECTQAKLVQKEIVAKLEVEIIETKTISVSLDGVLLFVQNLYKSLVENMSFNEMRIMDRLDYILEVITTADVSKVASWASQVVSDARTGLLMDPVNEVTSLMRLVSSLLSSVNQMLSSVLQAFVGLYYVILSMSMQLFEKGYINPIPKMEKQEGDLTDTSTGGEGGGFGEGEVSGDARDVTDEMEESGQIEGLQDDECEPTNGDAGQNKDPIEMDEDFADDMRDIDRGEATDHDMSDEGSEEAPQFQDILGEVDEADDQQLDPKLWDDEEKDKDLKEYDAGNTAADNKTDELTTNEHGTVEADEKPSEGEDEKDCCEQQMDAEDVDGQEHDEIQELEMMQDDPSTEFGDEEIQDTQDIMTADKAEDDSTDGEMENDDENNAGKVDGSEEVTEEANTVNSELDERETEHNTAELETVQQGTGGEQKNLETSDKTGGANEEMSEECQNDEEKGSSKNDDRGEKGKSVKSVDSNEGKDEEEKEKTSEEKNATEKKRELAHAAEDVEDKAKGEGELDDSGNQMQDSSSAEIQMIGPGSLEEAMESAKDYATNRPKSNIEPLCAGEENNNAPLENDDNAEEQYQVSIYLAPEQMFNLVEDFTKELTVSLTGVDKATGDTRFGDSKDLSEAKNEWAQMSQTVEILAAELAENLRLILEPQRVSKMQGDYRTGKRLNMRRLIPYIASEYRKDRIWMRRTKKTQREYQVLIAVDDSASMNENGIHQVTYESVCIIEDALRRCDAGAVSVCSFGSDVKIINAFSDYMMYGPEFLQKLTFNQSSTDLLLLLNSSRQMLCDVRTQTSEQLLIIISDGRGALAHGVNKIRTALSTLQGVVVLFVILDSGPKSIYDLSVATFQRENVILRPYLETFPFPFYVVVKAITQLPSVLAESIRQWFEMTVQNISV